MDLRQLRYFVAIVEQGSFSRAAQVLNIAQPALSAHVRNMEADLGMQLLLRSAQGVMPTEAGTTLLRNARLVIEQVATAEAEVRGHAAEPRGEVHIGIPGTISQKLAVPLILAVRQRYPGIKLRIAEAMSGFVLDWLRAGHVDLAILYIPAVDRRLASECLCVEQLCLLGPAGSRSGPHGSSIDFGNAIELPLILPGRAHGLREMLERLALSRNASLNSSSSSAGSAFRFCRCMPLQRNWKRNAFVAGQSSTRSCSGRFIWHVPATSRRHMRCKRLRHCVVRWCSRWLPKVPGRARFRSCLPRSQR